MFSFIWNHSFEIILSFPQLLEFPLISWEFHSRFCNSYNQITRREMLLCSVAQSCPTLVTPWTVACQATPSMEFSRQESWSRLSFPSPGESSQSGDEARVSHIAADPLTSESGCFYLVFNSFPERGLNKNYSFCLFFLLIFFYLAFPPIIICFIF